jgi:large subunit ribosomal protein L31
MKKNIHPISRDVVFHDTNVDKKMIIQSTLITDKTIMLDGKEYPYMTLDVSSFSHPFYTGKQMAASTEGRIANFERKFSNFKGKA